MLIRSITLVALLLGLASNASAQSNGAVTRYIGMCDASAAVEIGKGHFVVADDEQTALYVYRVGDPKHVARIDLEDYLGVKMPGKKPEETDIEGAARIGNRIYWIASHGASSKGKPRPARRQFFATTVTDSSVPPTVEPLKTKPYTKLLENAIADPRFTETFEAASKLAPEDDNGLGIEGLAATSDGKLLIGLRNPRPGKLALVLPLMNPAEVLDSGKDPIFGDLIRLDLRDRGIRSLEWTGSDYLIVAGPHNDNRALGFGLYRWDGKENDQPRLLDQKLFPDINPEALFKLTEGNRYYLLSDDGDSMVGGKTCKGDEVPMKDKGFRGVYLE